MADAERCAGRNEHSCLYLAAEMLLAYEESHTMHAIVFGAELPRRAIYSISSNSIPHHNLESSPVTTSPAARLTAGRLPPHTATCPAAPAPLQQIRSCNERKRLPLCLPACCREHVSRTGCVHRRCTALAAGRPASSTCCAAQHTHGIAACGHSKHGQPA